jgi:hypothetical protein
MFTVSNNRFFRLVNREAAHRHVGHQLVLEGQRKFIGVRLLEMLVSGDRGVDQRSRAAVARDEIRSGAVQVYFSR